jgi:hypothetical protein
VDEKCKTCQHLESGYTMLLGGYMMKESYCSLTKQMNIVMKISI